MKVVSQERERLEALARRLQSLSSGSSQELHQMKEQRQQLREELEQKEAQHGESLRRGWPKDRHKPSSTAPTHLHLVLCPWQQDGGVSLLCCVTANTHIVADLRN